MPSAKVEYDLSPAETESKIREALIGMGWTPPGQAPFLWHSVTVVPPPAAADNELIAVLKDGRVCYGHLVMTNVMTNRPNSFGLLVLPEHRTIDWTDISCWTYKPK